MPTDRLLPFHKTFSHLPDFLSQVMMILGAVQLRAELVEILFRNFVGCVVHRQLDEKRARGSRQS